MEGVDDRDTKEGENVAIDTSVTWYLKVRTSLRSLMLDARGSRDPERVMREAGGVLLEGAVGVYEFVNDGCGNLRPKPRE